MRIAIFGGSFNPVHRAHLALAEQALSELNLDRIIFVPCRRSPLKEDTDLIPAAVRVKLLKKAIRGNKYFFLSSAELVRKGASYTVDTLRYFKRRLGKHATLYFLAGADSMKYFNQWRSSDKIPHLCRIAVAARPGSSREAALKRGFLYLPGKKMEVSASGLRQALKQGRSLKETYMSRNDQRALMELFKKDL